MNCSVFHPGDGQTPTGSKVVKICINIFPLISISVLVCMRTSCAVPMLGSEKGSGSPGTGVRADVGRAMCTPAC